jgi:hypothetical protein
MGRDPRPWENRPPAPPVRQVQPRSVEQRLATIEALLWFLALMSVIGVVILANR